MDERVQQTTAGETAYIDVAPASGRKYGMGVSVLSASRTIVAQHCARLAETRST